MSIHRFASSSVKRHPFSDLEERTPLPPKSVHANAAPGPWEDASDPVLLGESSAIRRLRSQVQRIAPYLRTALIRGETGTGKQLIARAFHANGPCAGGPFVVSNATALAEAISTDTAFAPATASLLASSHGGTLYLDGVGELPFALQAGLLRFLRACEERRSNPLVSRSDLPRPDLFRLNSRLPDTRILAATHRDLRTLSAIGQFRQDLYARLSVVEIFVPPLRQRIEDIQQLADWLLHQLAERAGHSPQMLAPATVAQLESRPWPANLADLNRVLTRAAALADGPVIEPRHLLSLVAASQSHPPQPPAIKLERLQDVIQQHVLEVLTRCGGNKLRAAELLGISRSTLYRMLDASSVSSGELPESR